MERVAQGFRGRLQADSRLLSAWTGLLLAVWVAASWMVWAVAPWSTGAPSPWLEGAWRLAAWVVVSVWLLRRWRRRPAGFAVEGELSWSGGHAEMVSLDGASLRGPARLQWRSPLLVGVTIDDVSGPLTLWLTPWRIGERSWWRLQRFLVLGRD